MEKRIIRLAKGAKIGPENQPIYGWAEVEAFCEGGLAVHKAAPGDKCKWMVTHEQSGLGLHVIGARTKARAVANMKAALAIGFDWNRGEQETLQALRETRGVLDALRAIAAE